MKIFIRMMVLGAAVILGLQVLPWPWAARVVPGASPLVALGSALSARQIGWVGLLAVPLLILALVRGRWFCRRLCPAGTLIQLVGRLKSRKPGRDRKFPSVGGWLAALILGSAAAGYTWFLGLDPLALFNSFIGVWRQRPLDWLDIVPAAGFGLVLVLTWLRPGVWCQKCCPLGAFQALLGRGGQWLRQVDSKPPLPEPAEPGPAIWAEWTSAETRRMFLSRRALLALGGAGLAGLTRWLRLGAEVYPLRPPGAAPESRFPGLCVRCGNCITVCPQRILAADLGQSGLGGFLTPIVDYERDYCDEWCAQCTRVCPSGALRPMALADKRRLVMGNARIDKTRCLAWSQQRACMVCSEFCPYLAIRAREQQGVPCPEVILEVCRGCGACQKHCPALPQKAIRVQGLAQRRVTA